MTHAERVQAADLGLTCGPDRCARSEADRRPRNAADLALRCARLRAHAEELRPFDTTGQLAANLRDFADLLEVADERAWFA